MTTASGGENSPKSDSLKSLTAADSLFEAGQLPQWAQRGEETEMTLSLGGRYAGQQRWSIRRTRGFVEAEVRTELGGVLPTYLLKQVSRLHPRTLALLSYTEGEGNRPSFELSLDYRAGLVRLWQRGEEATEPLIQPFLDPVSLLLWLREWRPNVSGSRVVHLAGGGTHVQRLENTTLQGENGVQWPTRTFYLRPGGARAWIEQSWAERGEETEQNEAEQNEVEQNAEAGRCALLQLEQPTRYGMVLATSERLGLGGSWQHRPKAGKARRRVQAGQ